MNPAVALQRAAAIRPALARRALETESARRVAAATFGELHEAGLFRLLQPARVGGAELDMGVLVEVSAELARGCAASAWVLANLASHHWMLGMWPQAAQDEVWGAGGESADALICASLIFPAGRAHACAGGYRLSGRWTFASGIDDSGWVMLGAIVDEGGGAGEEHWDGEPEEPDAFAMAPGEYRIFLLPKGDYRVRDTWHAAGLCGTGSNEVSVAGVLVPPHLTLPITAVQGGMTPGSQANPGPLYRIPLLPTFGYVVAGVTLGIAQGALDRFTGENRDRMASYSGRMLTDFHPVQARVAEAAASIDAAKRLLLGNCADIMADAAQEAAPAPLEKARLRRDAAFAAQLCRRAVELLFDASGGAALFLAHPAQRALRDIYAACSHIALNWDAAAAVYGRVALGHSADLPPYER